MVPFVTLVSLFALLSVFGRFHILVDFGWWTSLRLALAGMFTLTTSGHWGLRRPDLVRMVPPVLPKPELLVTATGMLEIVGVVGLMAPRVAPYAALGLVAMLIAVFPANIHAARQHLTIAGSPVESVTIRALLQVVFLTATIAVFLGAKGAA
jgi:uncharacterized membrane protein